MKRSALIISLLFVALATQAQNYLISFAGSGASTKVSIVQVDNLTSGVSMALLGSDILHLIPTTGISNPEAANGNMQIYPNPMDDHSTLTINAPVNGNAEISIVDLSGKTVYQQSALLSPGVNNFSVSGINQGMYFIKVIGNSYNYSSKLISNSSIQPEIKIEQVSAQNNASSIHLKSSAAAIDMVYTDGDQLIFKGVSGFYSTRVSDVPTSSKTITFNFVACTDIDNNHYTTVAIGSQVWMAENLKTTKLNDGTVIPSVTDNTAWGSLSTPGYCWYNNDAVTNTTYGPLYNWFAVNTAKLAPVGWHIPSNAEWTALTTFLGGENVAGGKLKETGISHWSTPNAGATNAYGFSALPAGYRNSVGSYIDINNSGNWWSSTINTLPYIFYRYMNNNNANVYHDYSTDTYGFSIRCIKD
jgi:uncharacterized protein (TIGR02145 family)